jgi:hypothetical protein
MKKNWIKGLDRVALVIAVPIAIFFGIYMSGKFTNDNRLFSSCPQIAMLHYTMTSNVQDYSPVRLNIWRSCGYSDCEILEYLKDINKTHAPELAEGLNKGIRLVDLKVISPGTPARILVGILWAITAGITSVLAVSGSTRGFPKTFRWLQSGFAVEEEKQKEKEPKNKKK